MTWIIACFALTCILINLLLEFFDLKTRYSILLDYTERLELERKQQPIRFAGMPTYSYELKTDEDGRFLYEIGRN